MGFFKRFIIAVPAGWLGADYLVEAVHWIFHRLLNLPVPWGQRGDIALWWICVFVIIASLVKHLPHLPRLALASLATWYATPLLIEGLFWTLNMAPPTRGPFLGWLYLFWGAFSFGIAHSWLRRVPPLTFLL
jgi:hypothetical protein